jgi:hypothetical protein
MSGMINSDDMVLPCCAGVVYGTSVICHTHLPKGFGLGVRGQRNDPSTGDNAGFGSFSGTRVGQFMSVHLIPPETFSSIEFGGAGALCSVVRSVCAMSKHSRMAGTFAAIVSRRESISTGAGGAAACAGDKPSTSATYLHMANVFVAVATLAATHPEPRWFELLETVPCHRLHDDEAKIIIIDLVHIPLHTSHGVS